MFTGNSIKDCKFIYHMPKAFSFGNDEDPLQGYLNNKEHVTHMHFKDFAGGKPGKASNLCPPGKGLIDFGGII